MRSEGGVFRRVNGITYVTSVDIIGWGVERKVLVYREEMRGVR